MTRASLASTATSALASVKLLQRARPFAAPYQQAR
jgi:hypothetical protein